MLQGGKPISWLPHWTNSNTLTRDYLYTAWTSAPGAGRLGQILSQKLISGVVTTIQHLYYTYDEVGNVATIRDVQNSNQKQCFTYDTLNRLLAGWSGTNTTGCTGSTGQGMYNETYGYPTESQTENGNLLSTTAMGSYTYGDAAHQHAVTAATGGSSGGAATYTYDANGNQITRTTSMGSFTLKYDAENRLIEVKKSGSVLATFVFDGDGNRIKSVMGGVTTSFIGGYFEWTGGTSTMVKYYTAGGAMRTGTGTGTTNLTYLLGDHLGSTSFTYRADTAATVTQLYKPWGESRYSSGTLPTKYTYTGQYSYMSSTELGLMFYKARWYDPCLTLDKKRNKSRTLD